MAILYVAFLRGVNVGGHVARKEQLLEAFASLGFQNVFTYKQSGNVVFESSAVDVEQVRCQIEKKLRSTLGYEVAVAVRAMPQLKAIISATPFLGREKEGTSFLVTLLPCPIANFPLQLPMTIPKSTAIVVSSSGTEVFSETHGGGEGALPNPFLESKLKVKATTRNLNVIKEIVEKFT